MWPSLTGVLSILKIGVKMVAVVRKWSKRPAAVLALITLQNVDNQYLDWMKFFDK